MPGLIHRLWKRLPELRSVQGPLTEELVLEPGRYGLGLVPSRLAPDQTMVTVCGFCSVGCGLSVHRRSGEAVNLSPSPSYPVNLGLACPKGWEALTPLRARDRATTPLLRNGHGELEPVDWETALRAFCERFKSIQLRHGNESVAFLSTGQIVSEEMALLGALAKFGMGMLHGDGNTRQCMATAATAYKQSFGFDAPPFSYQDLEQSDVLVFTGANPCIAHPVLWQRVMQNPHRAEIIVIDPRKTETAMAATQHYALRPRSDLVLLYGVARALIEQGWIDREFIGRHTSGFDAFRAHVAAFTPDRVSAATGLTRVELERLCETIGRGQRVSFWWTMGVNQGHEATRTAQAIINLALITGNIGRPGTGANSITGQCNAMGSRLFSNTTNLLCGHDFENPEHRRKVAAVLGTEVQRIPDRDSWAYDEIVRGIAEDRIKGLWVIATNSAHSWIDQNELDRCLDRLEFLVVQDMYSSTETAIRAALVLPAAGWGEKDGTFINSERRIGLTKRVARPPGLALPDFEIFCRIAEAWGCGEMFRGWTSPEAVFGVLKELSRGQPCDFTGIRDYRMIEEAGGIQWPFPEGMPLDRAQPRLFTDGRFFHDDGLARFVFEEPREPPEAPDHEYPFWLLTGRGSSAQWHTETRTAKSAVLRKLSPRELRVEINPLDASRLGLVANQPVWVISRRGRLKASALVTPTIQAGQVFLPMHDPATNQLTHPSFDPYSRQPSYKACAVKLERAERNRVGRG